ncbi:hypothetical protein AB0912_15775 [Streptomyces sp. NPDC007084]|uniref:hypothetical protein n=1 Tax=Streptomyces sp. NPDC007084 TaxID=3154313 RepID=UPI0034556472
MTPTDAQLWAAGLAFVLPPVMAFVIQPRWGGPLKGIFALLIAAGDGIGTAYVNHEFEGRSIVTCMLTAVVVIGVAYHTLWRPSGIAPAIEAATSTGGSTGAGTPPRAV